MNAIVLTFVKIGKPMPFMLAIFENFTAWSVVQTK